MKTVLNLVSNSTQSNTSLISKLTRALPSLKQDQKLKFSAEQIQRQILNYNISSNAIPQSIKQSSFQDNLQYRKQIIRYYFKQNIDQFKQKEKQQIDNLDCINHITKFLKFQQTKNNQYNIKTILQFFEQMQNQYIYLKRELRNDKLLQDIHKRLNISQSMINNQLKALAKKQLSSLISIKIKSIKECVPHVKQYHIYRHWMFDIFDDLIEFNGFDKTLKLSWMTLPQQSIRLNDQTYKRLDISIISINFRKDTEDMIEEFINKLQNTYKLISSVQLDIKNTLVQTIKIQNNLSNKKVQQHILEQIVKGEQQFRRKAGQQILPSVYFFSEKHRQRLYRVFNIEISEQANTVAALLLSYRYSVYSKYIQNQFEGIAHQIAQKLIEGNQQQFSQICFFLQINTKTVKKKEATKNIKSADFALNLVSVIINDCIDKIEYDKIQKLLRIQNSLKQFKYSITY